MDSTRTLVEVSTEALKTAIAATTWVEVLLAEDLATEAHLEEATSKVTPPEEEEATHRSSSTNTDSLRIKVTIALWVPTRVQHALIGTANRVKISTTITITMVTITISIDNQMPLERVSSRHHQMRTLTKMYVHLTITTSPQVRVC